MKATDHLRFIKSPGKDELKALAKIDKNIRQWMSSDETATQFITEILQLFHDAYQIQPESFINDIFFPNQLAIRETYASQDFSLTQFKKAKNITKLVNRQLAFEQVYRSIVADQFDAYISILVASIQVKEGNFQSFELANLQKGEFNKYEFLKRRLKTDGLLKGYFPVIRNAISHAGSHGVKRENDHITFRNIKRGEQPTINNCKTVTTTELSGYIQDLIDLVVALEAAINIMGLDLKNVIMQTPTIAREFQSLANQKQLAERRRKKDRAYEIIWNSSKLSPEEKREHFVRLFAQGCEKNALPATTIQFKDKFVIIQIPKKPLAEPDDKHLVNRVAELIDYLLLAEMFFHFQFTDYIVEESKEPGQTSLQLWLKADDLKAYSIGEAHMLDLMHDGKLFRDEKHQPIIVNFEQLDEELRKSLSFDRKRKKR